MTRNHILHAHLFAPVEIVQARGTRLFDQGGKAYVDLESACWCMALGHAHPRIQESLRRQSERVAHLGPMLTNSLAEEAAAALLRHFPHSDGDVVFLSSGSEAVEMGIRLARLATGRPHLLSLKRSYLGAYGDARQESESLWTQVDIAACQGCPHGECRADCPSLRHVEPEQTAAFVLEPLMASGGIIVPPAKLIRFLASAVQAAGGLVVVDEVTTGLGRTGTWWGYEHAGVTPDVISCGKALGNGYPVSAVIISPPVAEAVRQRGFGWAQSHQNDPLAAVIAHEVIRVLEEERLIERAQATAAVLGETLRALQAEHPLVADVRGLGLLYGVELHPRLVDGRPAVEVVWERLVQHGFIPGVKTALSLLRFLPPLIISPAEIAAAGAALGEILDGVERNL